LSCVLRRRQQWRLLQRAGVERSSTQALGYATANAKTCHRLHELRRPTRAIHRRRRWAGRIDREAAKLPIQSDLAQGGGAGDLIAGDAVTLERAGVDVAHPQV